MSEIVVANVPEIIAITFDDTTGDSIVSGRELHEKLAINSNYSTWIKRMIDYGFYENVDFIEVWSDSKNGNAVDFEKSAQYMSSKGYQINHLMKLDMAKEIAMIQRSPEGKAIRQYLIEIEKAWNTPEKIMERALIIANNNIKKLTLEVGELKPKAEVYDNFVDKEHTLGFRELRKELESALGISIKETELKVILRELKLIGKTLKATAYAIRNEYAVTKDIELPCGSKTQDRFTMKARNLVFDYIRKAEEDKEWLA